MIALKCGKNLQEIIGGHTIDQELFLGKVFKEKGKNLCPVGIGGIALKGGLGQFAHLRGVLVKKRGEGGVIPQCKLCLSL